MYGVCSSWSLLLTCRTGIPAMIELGSSSADELTVSLAPHNQRQVSVGEVVWLLDLLPLLVWLDLLARLPLELARDDAGEACMIDLRFVVSGDQSTMAVSSPPPCLLLITSAWLGVNSPAKSWLPTFSVAPMR